MRQMETEPEAFLWYAQNILAQIEQENITYPDQITCLAGNCSFAISWKGDMRPCVTFDKPAVSVFEKSFEPAWKEISQEAKKLRVSEICVTCSLRPACKTCPASAYLETGSCDGVPEYLCRYTKEFVRLLREAVEQEQEAESNG